MPSEAEEADPEDEQPEREQTLSERAAVSEPRPEPINSAVPADYGYFEDPEPSGEGRETQEDLKLKEVMETVKAPTLALNLGDLLNLAPINAEAEIHIAELAHRLSPDELVNRLAPLFKPSGNVAT